MTPTTSSNTIRGHDRRGPARRTAATAGFAIGSPTTSILNQNQSRVSDTATPAIVGGYVAVCRSRLPCLPRGISMAAVAVIGPRYPRVLEILRVARQLRDEPVDRLDGQVLVDHVI